MPENDREWCAQLLRDHENRYHATGSIPVKISTKWFKFSGGWKAAVAILAIIAAVAITYLRSK